jgi:hypothetical protein
MGRRRIAACAYMVEHHCSACHRNTLLRRRVAGGGVCFDCGAFYPDVPACLFHDRGLDRAETVADRHEHLARTAGFCPWPGDEDEDPCLHLWTSEQIDALPSPHVAGCADCPEPYVVTKYDAGEAIVYVLTDRGHWTIRPDDGRRFHNSIQAYAAARARGGEARRLDRVRG